MNAQPTGRNLDVLCAVSRVWLRDGRATLETVAAETGLAPSTVYGHLQSLRFLGLVDWGDAGSMRPGSVN